MIGVAAVTTCAGMRFSGVMGQSQTPGSEPIPCSGMRGAVPGENDTLWTLCGPFLYQMDVSGDVPVAKKRHSVYSFNLRGINGKLYFSSAGNLKSIDPQNGKISNVIKLPPRFVAFCRGTGKYRFMALSKDKVYGEAGGQWHELFKPVVAKGHNYSIGIEPQSGDVLIGSSYPTMKIRRYSLDGKEHKDGSWPRTGHSRYLVEVNKVAWALFNRAVSLPADLKNIKEVRTVGDEWSSPVSGMIIDSKGRYWLTCDQGLLGYDARGNTLDVRAGGVSNITALSVSNKGELYAVSETRLIRIPIDAGSSDPFTSNQSKYLIGRNYRSKGCDMKRSGNIFLVLDNVKNMLWSFDSEHMRWNEKTWKKLTPENYFKKPLSLALNSQDVYVLDGGKILRSAAADLKSFTPVKIDPEMKGLTHICTQGDVLFCTSPDTVAAYRMKGGAGRLLWKSNNTFSGISGIAVDKEYLVVTEAVAGKIQLLNVKDGKVVDSIDKSKIPGGMKPTTVCIRGPWIFVYDDPGKRILRFCTR